MVVPNRHFESLNRKIDLFELRINKRPMSDLQTKSKTNREFFSKQISLKDPNQNPFKLVKQFRLPTKKIIIMRSINPIISVLFRMIDILFYPETEINLKI